MNYVYNANNLNEFEIYSKSPNNKLYAFNNNNNNFDNDQSFLNLNNSKNINNSIIHNNSNNNTYKKTNNISIKNSPNKGKFITNTSPLKSKFYNEKVIIGNDNHNVSITPGVDVIGMNESESNPLEKHYFPNEALIKRILNQK